MGSFARYVKPSLCLLNKGAKPSLLGREVRELRKGEVGKLRKGEKPHLKILSQTKDIQIINFN